MPWKSTLCALVILAGMAPAADWPQWLGPARDGASAEIVKPWKGDLQVLWRLPVGPGHSSPVVAGGKVYLHTKTRDKEAEEVTAYDAKTGTEVWRTSYPRVRFFSPFGTGPQSTPAVVGGKVFSFGATGVLACFDAEKGALAWSVPTQDRYKAANLFFGASSSPLIEGDKVIVNVGAKGASVVAFKRDSGEEVWKSQDDRASYSSGIAFGPEKARQALFLTQQGLRSFDAADGKLLWRVPFVDKLNESSTTPVLIGGTLLASSVTLGSMALELKGKDAPKELWRNKVLTCYFSTPIPVGADHVYMVNGQVGFTPTSTLRCIELKTGKELWKQEKVGKYHAALLRTGDNKLLMLSDLGYLALIDPDPKSFKELCRFQVVKGEQIWAHPALSDGRVYIRDEKELICLQLPR